MKTTSPHDRPVPLVDLSSPHGELEAELVAAFLRVLRSGRYILGREVEDLEAALAAYLGVEHAVGLSSGTDALLASLMALELGPDDEVVCPAFTFFGTAGSVVRAGARPVFCDVSPATFNAGRDEIEARLTERTRAVVVVHLFGRCADIAPIVELAHARGLTVVEDAAQALGAARDGRRAGSFGDIGTFSFFPTKSLGALGDGGLAATGSDRLAERIRKLRNHGEVARYVHDLVGGNFRLDALQAALLRVKLPLLEAMNERRRQAAERYTRLFRESGCAVLPAPGDRAVGESGPGPALVLPAGDGPAHVFHQYVVRVTPPGARDQLREGLGRRGIETQVYYPLPLHLQPCFGHLGYAEGSCPVAELLCSQVLALPMHPGLSVEDQERVVGETCSLLEQ